MASNGVFVRVVSALNHSISGFPTTPSIILTLTKQGKKHSHQTIGHERVFYEGRQRTKQTERQPRIVVDFIKVENLDD